MARMATNSTGSTVSEKPADVVNSDHDSSNESVDLEKSINVAQNHDCDVNQHQNSSQGSHDAQEGEPGGDALHDTDASSGPPHSIFSKTMKRFIIFITMWCGMISPISAQIYFPALNALAADLSVSNSLINLTLTSYMIFQGIAPAFVGDFADMAGRRPAFIIGLTIYIGACVGIALQDSFAALFVLRCIQSTGSSGTVALASGVVADISTSSERGKYMGWVTSGMLVGPAISPILGGILGEYLGWRAIFWFLVILVGVLMIPLIIAFPETARNIVGNGSIPPQGWNMSVLNYLAIRKKARDPEKLEQTVSRESRRVTPAGKRKLRFPNPLSSLKIILEKDMSMLLAFNGLMYVAFYDVAASNTYLFAQIYGFNELQVGLSFIPLGFGTLTGVLVNGYILDWHFGRVARRLGYPVDKKKMMKSDFPFEMARVPVAVPEMMIGIAALLCYGWVIEVEAPLAAPLVLQFILGACVSATANCFQVMLVDSYPMQPATATAANNLVRCLLGAGGTAAIIPMINAMGRGWCFTFIALVLLSLTPIFWILQRWGPKWRKQRLQKQQSKAEGENR